MTSLGAPIPVIETARLRLRGPVLADLDAYRGFLTSPRAGFVGGPFAAHEAFPKLAAVAGTWALLGYGRWVVADRASDAALGLVGLIHPDWYDELELGWTLFAGEGRGIAQEAALAARRFAYETLGLGPLMSLCAADNARSVALARRLGCTPDGAFDYPGHGPVDRYRHPREAA